jgi:hypothetical protein
MFCRWGLLLEVAEHLLTRFRQRHCLHRLMVKLGVRRCIWLKCSLPWSAIAMASPADSLPALRRYAGILTRSHPVLPGWDKPLRPRPNFFKRAGTSGIEASGRLPNGRRPVTDNPHLCTKNAVTHHTISSRNTATHLNNAAESRRAGYAARRVLHPVASVGTDAVTGVAAGRSAAVAGKWFD